MLPYGCGTTFQAKYQAATLLHMKLTHFGTGSLTTFDFSDPDKPTHYLAGEPSIRSLLLRINARNTTTPLFLAINPATKANERGGYVITYCKSSATEAEEKITNLAAFFKHQYGEESLERFTVAACEQADNTQWDEVNDRPITAKELYLDETMEEELDWVANLDDVNFESKQEEKIIIERPKNPDGILKRQPAYPQSADDDTIGTFFPGQNVADTNQDEDNSTTNEQEDEETSMDTNAIVETKATQPVFNTETAEDSGESSAKGVT
jgi:hypothetical protein